MSIFNNILEKLGIKKAPETTKTPAAPAAGKPVPNAANQKFAPVGHPQAAPVPAMPMVDITSKLDALAKKSPIALNWRVSINDLMALLGLDHKSEDIKQLAVELGCPASEMDDSYKRNVWTHKELLKRIAANGGNVPANLLN